MPVVRRFPRLRATVDRYSFDVENSHLLLHAGLSRRFPRPRFSLRPYANRRPRGHRRFNTGSALLGPPVAELTMPMATFRCSGIQVLASERTTAFGAGNGNACQGRSKSGPLAPGEKWTTGGLETPRRGDKRLRAERRAERVAACSSSPGGIAFAGEGGLSDVSRSTSLARWSGRENGGRVARGPAPRLGA